MLFRILIPDRCLCPQAKATDDDKDIGISIILQQHVSLTFSLKYLQNFAKSAPLAEKVTLNMSNEVPLLVAFDFEQGHINYYLAPKVSGGAGETGREAIGALALTRRCCPGCRSATTRCGLARRPDPTRDASRADRVVGRGRGLSFAQCFAFDPPFFVASCTINLNTLSLRLWPSSVSPTPSPFPDPAGARRPAADLMDLNTICPRIWWR